VVPLDVLREACEDVYKTTRGLIGTPEGNRHIGIGAGGDLSRKIDVEAEEAVIRTIRRYGLCPTVIGEECGTVYGQEGYLVIDPIDGTANAAAGLPFYCCSLAYASENRLSSVLHAAIMDLFRGEIFVATKDMGAYLNDMRINVNSQQRKAADLIIGMNISRTSSNDIYALSKLIKISDHVRLFGANALELCYLAKGSLDACIDLRGKIRATDMAAAYLIVREAGGTIYSLEEQVLDAELGADSRMSFIAAKSKDLYDIIIETLRTENENKQDLLEAPGPGFEPGSKE
jgi:myo-inositol-1(or 4)-monophosphatase